MIIPYTPQHRDQLLELLRLNIPRYFDPAEEKDFAEYLDQHLEDYFVVEENGMVIGSGGINYFPGDGIARISWDVIHPDSQGKGTGSKLLLYRLEHIKKHAAIKVIYVRTTQLVYPFYEKGGFKLEKIEKDFWAKGFDLYQMKMVL